MHCEPQWFGPGLFDVTVANGPVDVRVLQIIHAAKWEGSIRQNTR